MKNMILGTTFSAFAFFDSASLRLFSGKTQCLEKKIITTHSFGNKGYETTPAEVKAVRK
jgi:hypothetical protein